MLSKQYNITFNVFITLWREKVLKMTFQIFQNSLIIMQYINKLLLLTFLSVGFASLMAQETFTIEDNLDWNGTSFEGAFTTGGAEQLPLYTNRFALPIGGKVSARLITANFDDVSEELNSELLSTTIDIKTWVEWERKKPYCKVSFIPLKKENGIIQKLTDFNIRIDFQAGSSQNLNTRDQTYTSVLSDGDIYKIATNEYGIHKLDFNFLNDLGVDMNNVDPKSIKIYGNGGGKLAGSNSISRHHDLVENAIFINGENDGSFDANDYILFYAEGADKKVFDEATNTFYWEKNNYDDNNYYFIKISSGNGLRVSNIPSVNNTTYTSNSFNDFQRLEEEKNNILKDFLYSSGSGRQWFGDKFDLVSSNTYNFNFPNIDTNSPLMFDIGFIGRKEGSQYLDSHDSYFKAKIENQDFTSSGMNATAVSNVEARHAYEGYIVDNVMPSSDNISVTIQYDAPGAEGWLDYINLNCRRALTYGGEQLTFRDLNSVGQVATNFQLAGINSNIAIWDISNPLTPKVQDVNINGSQISFGGSTETLREFIAFDMTSGFKTASAIGQIGNQNLHATSTADAILIYHKDFETAAITLAEHRQNHSNITVVMAEISEIFNEFSSGSKDPVAIRDYAKMLYDRDENFKYLILLGDGTFDYKNIYNFEFNPDFIPVYETKESLSPIQAFPSDDYYCLLDANEGIDLKGALDIAVGRIPVSSSSEANIAVQKIIAYDTDPDMLRDWRTRITFVADDEDGNTHINQSDGIATIVDTTYHDFNINKIYFDAFQQKSSSGGNTFPDVIASINSSVFKGQLVINYLGHGGPTSWAQERVLQVSDINSWQNKSKLPLFITATCSFTAYDDPERESAGEKVFLRENGGGIGLYTTVRAVYAQSNERLTKATFEHLFEKENGVYPAIGTILVEAKNSNSADTIDTNARKFALIGDPSMHLAIPQQDVLTTSINSLQLTETDTVSISALEEVTISGIIADENGNKLTNFNGIVYPTVYDKPQTISTLGNDPSSYVREFTLQKNIIFKGAASVSNGDFTFTFIVPKDINYEYGLGRISYYAQDESTMVDAAGSYEKIRIGGTATNPIKDDTPPLVEVFMNDTEFVFGGITSTNPVLYVKLSDDFGINVAGTGIGHDLTAVLDDDNQNIIVLNDFYEAEVNDFKKGEARYPLTGIEPGLHTLRVKGWDIANNSGEGYTEFVVADNAEIALEHVLNYPNPFTTNTEFQFEHNLAGQMLRVEVRVFTVSGKLVKTISKDIFAEGNRMTGIQWDGTDDFGDKIGRGVYLYKISVGNISDDNVANSASSKFEKLVILK